MPLAISSIVPLTLNSWGNLTESFSDHMEIFLIPPNDCSCHREGVLKWLHISPTGLHPYTLTHTHSIIWIIRSEPTLMACSAYSLLPFFFVERKNKCLLEECDETACLHVWGKKSMKQSTNGALYRLSAVGFFLVRNKNQQSPQSIKVGIAWILATVRITERIISQENRFMYPLAFNSSNLIIPQHQNVWNQPLFRSQSISL
jgi:hypothetical protein